MKRVIRFFSLYVFFLVLTGALSFFATVVEGEKSIENLTVSNEWLARDLAQQFSKGMDRPTFVLNRVVGLLGGASGNVSSVSGISAFSNEIKREFELEPSARGFYLFDPAADEPLAKLERSGLEKDDASLRVIQEAVEKAAHGTPVVRGLGAGTVVMAARVGEAPRVVVVTLEIISMLKADGGPRGEIWALFSDDRRVLIQSDPQGGAAVPTPDEIAALILEENPTGDRSEWSRQWETGAGLFQVNAVRAGLGVSALSMASIERASSGPFSLLLQISAVLSLFGATVFAWILSRRSTQEK